jgi:methylated-DNA-[protein]-cysteine S-methyltransferase
MALFARRIGTPLGEMVLALDESDALVALEFCNTRSAADAVASVAERAETVAWDDARGGAVVGQLDEYFRGERRDFDLPLAPRGSEFQRRVWDELRRIPFGRTISYGELAERVGKRSATAARAVGQANATNPIAIIVPCHRVIGADGTLTGYAAGLSYKAKLLALEGALVPDALAYPHAPRVRESARTSAARRPGAGARAASGAGQAELFPEP